jgi:hypothetical protein
LIHQATLDRQEDRPDISEIQNELVRLYDAIEDPTSVRSAELLAEEIAARATGNRYEWDGERLEAKLLETMVAAKIFGSENERLLKLTF